MAQPTQPRVVYPNRNYVGITPPGRANQPPTDIDIVETVYFAMNVARSDAPDDAKAEALRYAFSLVGEDAPPLWALPLINAVWDMRDELQRANLPRMKEDIDAIRNDIQNIRETFAAADFPQVKDDIETMKKELKSLPTKSYVSEKLKEELKPVKTDVNRVRKTLDSVKEDMTAVAPGRLERTITFTNKMYIDRTQQSNMMRMLPTNLQQVPAPDGTLPWNTRIRGPGGEEIVLAPLDSLEAVQALGASEVGAYVQLYYPGREAPADLVEQKRLVLQAIGRYEDRDQIV